MAILQLMEKHPTPLKGVRKCLTLPEIKVPPFPNPPEWCRIFSPQKVRWELSPQQKTQEILENTSSFLLRMAGEIPGEPKPPTHVKGRASVSASLQSGGQDKGGDPRKCEASNFFGGGGDVGPKIQPGESTFGNGCFLGIDFWEPSIFVWWFLVTEWFLSTVS